MKLTPKIIAANLIVTAVVFLPLLVNAQGLVKCQNPPNCSFQDFMNTLFAVINFIVQLGIAFSAIVFAYAGWLYMTSGGDEGKIKQAHELFIKVLWGFLFALGGYLIVQLIATSLGVQGGYIIF